MNKKILKSKKAMILYYIVIPGFIAGLIMFYITSLNAAEPETKLVKFIGEKQLRLLQASNEAQKYLLYLDQSAKLSAQQSVYELADNGGFAITSPCGDYLEYPIWKTKDKDCYPSDYKTQFKAKFSSRLNQLMQNKEIIQKTDTFIPIIPEDINYEFFIDESQIVGIPDKEIKIGISFSGLKLAEYEPVPSFNIKTDFNIDEFAEIIDQAAVLAEACSQNSDLTSCIETNKPENWQTGSCQGNKTTKDRNQRFCVKSKSNVLAHDKETGKTEYILLTYKFALQFQEPLS